MSFGVNAVSLKTQAEPKSTLGKIIQFPITRIIIAVLFLAPVALIHNALMIYLIEKLSEPYFSIVFNIERIINFLLFVIAYKLYVNYIERREAYEISFRNCGKEFGLGFLIAGGFVIGIVLLLYILGYYQIVDYHPVSKLINAFFGRAIGALIQVIIFRLILFRLIEELTGSWAAIGIVMLIFGLAHSGNENATVQTTIAIMLGDLMLAAAFVYTRRLWLVWGMHTSWNFLQDGVFGLPNSGITSLDSWTVPSVTGPEWITGGNFGIEASYIVIIISLLIGVLILKKAIGDRQILSPIWKRKQPVT